jgi:UPF0755 protein
VKRLLLGLLLVLLLAALAAGGWFYWRYDELKAFAARPFGKGPITVEIPTGTGPSRLGRLLADAGAVSDAQSFTLFLRFLRKGGHPKAGEYELPLPLSPEAILERLERGEVKLYRFTVPEGLRADEIAPIVGRTGLCAEEEFLAAARSASVAKRLGVPAGGLEGWLFPDTYSVPRGIGCAGILAAMLARFREAFRAADAQRSPGVALDEREAVTLASIIEKETGQAAERPRISCVFHNRLRKRMKLQTDPTVIYAVLLQNGFRWSGNLRRSDLERPHPYNTYAVAGLPPGPIANPGAAALAAALHPLSCNDLFFVSRNDRTHVFCPDYACHLAAVQKWQVEYFKAQREGEQAEQGE